MRPTWPVMLAHWTTADLDRARELANLVARPRGGTARRPRNCGRRGGRRPWPSVRPLAPRPVAWKSNCMPKTASPPRPPWTITSKRRSIVESCSRYSWSAVYLPSRGGDFLKPFTVKKWQTLREGHNLHHSVANLGNFLPTALRKEVLVGFHRPWEASKKTLAVVRYPPPSRLSVTKNFSGWRGKRIRSRMKS